LYNENYKTSLKDMKDYLNKWKDSPWQWIGRLNFIKKATLVDSSADSLLFQNN
jgi:hypothetical protein